MNDRLPLQYVVDGLLPEGLALLIAPPKYGKSWMAMQLCMAVARGGSFLGFPVNPGAVLYLALEDSARRLKERQERFLNGDIAPCSLYIATEAATIGNGLEAQLKGILANMPGLKLIVIDKLARVISGKRSINHDLAALKAFADAHHVCILVVHDQRSKAYAADVIIHMQKSSRTGNTAMLFVTGKTTEDRAIPIVFNCKNCKWEIS